MDCLLAQITRQLYPAEQVLLEKMKGEIEAKLSKMPKVHFIIIALLLGTGFTYLATITKVDFLVFVFGTIAVFAFGVFVFMPYEIYKSKAGIRRRHSEIVRFLERKTLKVTPVNAIRIALAEEYEDEGELFIVEYEPDKILYLWNHDFSFGKRFPCLEFEIYEDSFYELTERQIYSLSRLIKPIVIDRKLKWEYMSKVGIPEHLTTEEVKLDKLIEKFKALDKKDLSR